MNPKASQWLRLASFCRERELKLKRNKNLPTATEDSIPHAIRDDEVISFISQRMDELGSPESCSKLEIELTYQAILADPGAEAEILTYQAFDKNGKRMDELFAHATAYKTAIELEYANERKFRNTKGSSKLHFFLLSIPVLFLIVLAGIGGYAYNYLNEIKLYANQKEGLNKGKVKVNIARSSSVETITDKLAAEGVLKEKERFLQLAQLYHHLEKIIPELPKGLGRRYMRSGNYEISTSLTPLQILKVLKKGPIRKSIRVTVPEGFNVWKIAARLKSKGICDEQEFLRLARDRTYSKRLLGWDVPEDAIFPVEGYLYPDTYSFYKNTHPKTVLRKMIQRFHQKFISQFKEQARVLGWTIHQTVTMASIIEKETGKGHERPRISGVFHNRLRRKWQMETDPTVIYGLLPKFNGNLTQRDLHNPHKYNTYKHKGFPPGPIASPGVAAIRAALYPHKSCHIFFVAKNDGTHVFSCTKRMHRCWVDYYQKKTRKTKCR